MADTAFTPQLILIKAREALGAFSDSASFQIEPLPKEVAADIAQHESDWLEQASKAAKAGEKQTDSEEGQTIDAIIDDDLNLRAGWVKPSTPIRLRIAASALTDKQWRALEDFETVDAAGITALLEGRMPDDTPQDTVEKLEQQDHEDLHRVFGTPSNVSDPGDEDEGASKPAEQSTRAGNFRQAKPKRERTKREQWGPFIGTAAQRRELDKHVINLRAGRLSTGGADSTTPADVAALAKTIADGFKAGDFNDVVLYAHGGLVSEDSALNYAWDTYEWWLENKIYPVFFVWETGGLETIMQIIKAARTRPTTRSWFDPTSATDWLIEKIARAGKSVWGAMKAHALMSSLAQPLGGARLFARELAKHKSGIKGLDFHAVGHSAGSIFHTHFLSAMEDELGWDGRSSGIASVQFLAPAVNLDDYMDGMHAIASRANVDFTCFTMNRRAELDDHSLIVYRKSLLYLVSRAFEDEHDTPIFGLEDSLRGDTRHAQTIMQAFHAGDDAYELILGPTGEPIGPKPWRSATEAEQHGDFDNDAPTMESVAGRIRNSRAAPFPASLTRTFDSGDTTLYDLLADQPSGGGGGHGFGGASMAPPPPLPPPSGSGAPLETKSASVGPQKVVLSIGIDDFPGDNRLRGCKNDSRAWLDMFAQAGFTPLPAVLDHEATGARIRREFQQLVENAGPGDMVAIHMSSHGTQVDDVDGDEPSGNPLEEALVCHDFRNPDGLIIDDQIYDILNQVRAGVCLTTIFDLCHSGNSTRAFRMNPPPAELRGAKARHMTVRNRAASFALKQVRGSSPHDVVKPLRYVSIAACQPHQKALEINGLGLFTGRALPVLQQQGVGASASAFMAEVERAFGTSLDTQRPLIEGPAGWESRALFQPAP